MWRITTTRCVFLLALVVSASVISVCLIPSARAENPYSLSAIPAFAQEGSTITLVLSYSNATGNVSYQYVFYVKDPSGQTSQSSIQTYTTRPGETHFTIVVPYPSASFQGSNSLVGLYTAHVDQLLSVAQPTVAITYFILSIADNVAYERTQTVNMQASGYKDSEPVGITITAQKTSTTVFSQTVVASSTGMIVASWKIPVNATVDTYLLSLAGTSTVKSPTDAQPFSVKTATMRISSISSVQSTYQRTEDMQFFFQPTYPDGSFASTGVALLTLARPSGGNVTLTVTYDNNAQNFVTSYKTTPDNETGTWTATLAAYAYSDSYGNAGPPNRITNSPQLSPADLTVTVATGTSFTVGQQIRFNASIAYPDGTIFQSGSVGAYLLYSGTQTLNITVPMVFDTGLMRWVGTYAWQAGDTGGLWSLYVRASDSATSPNNGYATRAVTLDNASGGNFSFPLFYFGIAAGLIAAVLIGGLFLFRRRRGGPSTSLKIDLEAVKSEAGRIGDQDFFQSIRDQVKKDKDD